MWIGCFEFNRMVLICVKEHHLHLRSRGAEVSAKQETIRLFVTPGGMEGHEQRVVSKRIHYISFIIYFYIYKMCDYCYLSIYFTLTWWESATYVCACLEHFVNALISNDLCNSCGKFGETIISKRHLPFCINSCKPGNVEQGTSHMDSECFIHSYLY